MKAITLALGDWKIKVYSGKEWKQYRKLHLDTTGEELPEEPGTLRKGTACLNGLWVADIKDTITIAHELIHTLSILHGHIGIKDQCPFELLANQHSYCLKKILTSKTE